MCSRSSSRVRGADFVRGLRGLRGLRGHVEWVGASFWEWSTTGRTKPPSLHGQLTLMPRSGHTPRSVCRALSFRDAVRNV